MNNPYTGRELPKKAAEYVQRLRTVRRNAKAQTRSGNPAVRSQAERVLAEVPGMIAAVYANEATR